MVNSAVGSRSVSAGPAKGAAGSPGPLTLIAASTANQVSTATTTSTSAHWRVDSRSANGTCRSFIVCDDKPPGLGPHLPVGRLRAYLPRHTYRPAETARVHRRTYLRKSRQADARRDHLSPS